MLEQAITNIGALLAVGFGDAGTNIIAQNMSEGGDLNPMMPGKRTYAVFGFCDIHHFGDVTEVLQSEIMTFVNMIAEIAHSNCHKGGGGANKNIGEAFLLVWKYKEPDEFEDQADKDIKDMNVCLQNRQIADMALFSFLKVICKINKYSHILAFRKNEQLTTAMPGFKVSMGFGLHTGWAIEGSIGSYFKIDASYLSPNVNMASRLEAASKQYGVPLLVSGDFYEVMTSETQTLCREIDTVTVKGSIKPVRLFTVDVETDALNEVRDRFMRLPNQMKKREHERERQDTWTKLERSRKTTKMIIDRDSDIIEMRQGQNQAFLKLFVQAYAYYKQGLFEDAHEMLKMALEVNPKDGPSKTLLEVIEDHGKKAPEGWQGYRALTSK